MLQQEIIPVGCLPPAFLIRGKGCLTPLPGCRPPLDADPLNTDPPPPVDRRTPVENITLPQTAFAGGKNKLTCVQQPQQVAAMY